MPVTTTPNEKITLIEETFKEFDITLLPNVDPEFIKKHWKFIWCDSKHVYELAQKNKFLAQNESLTIHSPPEIFCYFAEKPLFVHITAESEKVLKILFPLIKTLETKLKFVLVGSVQEEHFEDFKIFRNLGYLQNQVLYQKLVKEIKISLQGRPKQSIDSLKNEFSVNLDKVITPNEIILSLDDLIIGKEVKKLPEFHIPRNLNLKSNSNQSPSHNLCKNCDQMVDPKSSKIYENQVNVLYGEPGIGKSTMANYLARNCPPNYWVVVVPLQQVSFLFSGKLETRQIIKALINFTVNNDREIDERVSRYFLKEKKVLFLFDGLNELNRNTVGSVVKVIKDMVKEEYKIWIFCTQSVKTTIEQEMDAVNFYTIEALTIEKQKEYFRKRLERAKIQEGTIGTILEKVFKKHGEQTNEILKTPLLLYILSEVLSSSEERTLDEALNVNQIYSYFIDGKFQHNLNKTECTHLDKLKVVVEGFKSYCLRGYQLAALKVCLEPEIVDKLKIKIDNEFIQYMKKNFDFWGIMKVNEDDTFTFIHHTFAEYFAAMWLSENFENIPITERRFILKAEYDGIRKFFDTRLAEKCPLHLAILDGDIAGVRRHALTCLNQVDRGGRSPLHVAVIIGRRHPPIEIKDVKICPGSTNRNHKEILNYLLDLKGDPFKKDTFFYWNPFEYADGAFYLCSLEELSNRNDLSNFLKTTLEDLFSLSYYCVTLGYVNILRHVIINKSVDHLEQHHTEKPLLHLALEHNQTQIAKLLIENGTILESVDNENKTPLHVAAIWGNHEIAALLLEKGVGAEPRDTSGRTPFQFAAKMGHKKILELLLDEGVDINTQDSAGKTPLQKAAYMGNTETVEFLLDHEANVNLKNSDDGTALQRAAEMGRFLTVKCLVEKGAETNACDKGRRTALHFAAYEGHPKIVKYLVDQQCDIFFKNDDERTAKDVALIRGHQEVVDILETAESLTPRVQIPTEVPKYDLHDAVKRGNLEEVKRNRTRIEEVDESKETPLHIASLFGHLPIVQYLINEKVNTGVKNNVARVPLHYACQRGRVEIVKELLNRGQNEAKDKWGQTPLHRAAYKGHRAVVQLLIENKCQIDSVNNKGGTPLHSAAIGGNNDVIDYLVSKGASVEKTNEHGETCLHVAVRSGRTESVSHLIKENNKLLDMVDHRGRTALHWAAERGYGKMSQILVDAGADVNVIDNHRQTALQVAEGGKEKQLIEYLQACNL